MHGAKSEKGATGEAYGPMRNRIGKGVGSADAMGLVAGQFVLDKVRTAPGPYCILGVGHRAIPYMLGLAAPGEVLILDGSRDEAGRDLVSGGLRKLGVNEDRVQVVEKEPGWLGGESCGVVVVNQPWHPLTAQELMTKADALVRRGGYLIVYGTDPMGSCGQALAHWRRGILETGEWVEEFYGDDLACFRKTEIKVVSGPEVPAPQDEVVLLEQENPATQQAEED